jgi:hypothetical protein
VTAASKNICVQIIFYTNKAFGLQAQITPLKNPAIPLHAPVSGVPATMDPFPPAIVAP